MIFKRMGSVFIDLAVACIASVGAYLAGADYIFSVIAVYFVTVMVGLIYTGGKTIGMILIRILPLNFNGSDSSVPKLIFYHLMYTVFLLNPKYNTVTIILPVVVIIPLQLKKGRYTGVLDTLFKIHWIDAKQNA